MKPKTINDMRYKTISEMIDSPIEEVAKELNYLDMTNLTTLKKMVELEYLRVERTKDAMMGEYKNVDMLGKVKLDNLVQELYNAMVRIENLATVVETLRRERQ